MNVFIVDAKRTAIGSLSKGLATVPAADLGASVVKELVSTYNLKSEDIAEVITGNVLPAAAGQGLGRQVAVKAGIDESVCGSIVSMVCGSGVKSVNNAYGLIKGGDAKMIIAGGTENMSLSPYAMPGARAGLRLGDAKLVDTLVFDALTDAFTGIHMGITAENIAERYGITREQQDAFALTSQQRALEAIEKGYFKDEIVPVTIKTRKGEVTFDTDEHPKATTTDKLAMLRPAFKKDGSVTAGNASGINDGAAYMIVANDEMVEKYNFKPKAKILATAQAGIDPEVMGLGPAFAIRNLLAKTDLNINDIDIFELNEAFAAQSLGAVQEMAKIFDVTPESIMEKTNYCGGAIALGHPVGASGARIITTLVNQMQRLNKKYGIASLCIGGGMGIAILVENVNHK